MKKLSLFVFAVLSLILLFAACDNEPDDPVFDIPTLSLESPLDSAIVSESQPTFTWQGEGQLHYDFYFGTSEGSLYKQASELSAQSYTLDGMILQDSVTYFWKVIAVSDDGFRESEVRRFEVQ